MYHEAKKFDIIIIYGFILYKCRVVEVLSNRCKRFEKIGAFPKIPIYDKIVNRLKRRFQQRKSSL